VLTEEKLDEISARLEHSPQKSLRHLAQETRVSNCHKIPVTGTIQDNSSEMSHNA
jgi:hypothetical protein